MQIIQNGYRGLSLVVSLNWDRLIYPVAIIVGLIGGALIGNELMQLPLPAAPTIH